MDVATTAAVVGTGISVIGAAVAVGKSVGRKVNRVSRKVDQFREDWEGQPARPGFEAVPGVPERLQAVEQLLGAIEGIAKQLQPNGGSTLRDAVNRMELNQSRNAIDIGMLSRRFDQHLEQTAPIVQELIEWRRSQGLRSAEEEGPPAL